ncbi:BTB/POZ and MATH domain-containing protein 3-like [Triticum dicoccoides]|uniref:BTB/POZ and MATH domain-containing protein 3-like n=1 Tax=Triticum dicoccoides TaxID=85692 RepID=UPI000E7A6D68|nr:BTB/POZ and MATH domain-containing protein 3-like [Triticum dicoccoides]
MSFAGASIVHAGKVLQQSVTYPGTDSSRCYHLLVIEGYSHIKDKLTGNGITSRPFQVGGYLWSLAFYPNSTISKHAGYMSVFLCFDQKNVEQPVKVDLRFSFIDELDKQEHGHISQVVEFKSDDSVWGRHRFMKVEDLEQSKHINNDCFTIKCDLNIMTSCIEVPPSNIIQQLEHLHLAEVCTDVTFEVGYKTFTAHRFMLAARSSVFTAMLSGPMKETTTDTILIKEMEPDVFKALLDFVYTDSMPKMEAGGEAGEDGAEVVWLVELLAAADMYDFQRLVSLCAKRLSEYTKLSSVTDILDLAEQLHCYGLNEACVEFKDL